MNILDILYVIIISIATLSFVFYFIIFIITYLRTKNFYKKYEPLMDKSYRPKVAVIYPCKGDSPALKNSVLGVLNQDYSGEYEVVFVVESKEDSSYSAIKKHIEGYPHARLIIAGISEKCIQKNHNVIKALDILDDDVEVYTFIDAHNKPDPAWLTNLINMLSIEGIEVSTMYRVVEVKKNSKNHIYAALISALYTSNIIFNFIWGGSFSITKKDFEKHKLRETWESTMSHDSPLNSSNIRALCNPSKLVIDEHMQDTSLSSAAKWFKRQWNHFRIYNPKIFNLGLTFSSLQILILLSIPLWIVMSFIDISYLFHLVSVIGMVFMIMLTTGIIQTLHIDNAKLPIQIPMSFWIITLFFYALITSLVKKDISWAGKVYILDKDGKLESIEKDENHIDNLNIEVAKQEVR